MLIIGYRKYDYTICIWLSYFQKRSKVYCDHSNPFDESWNCFSSLADINSYAFCLEFSFPFGSSILEFGRLWLGRVGVLVPLPPPPLPVQDMLLPMVKRQTGYQWVIVMEIKWTKNKQIVSKIPMSIFTKNVGDARVVILPEKGQ